MELSASCSNLKKELAWEMLQRSKSQAGNAAEKVLARAPTPEVDAAD
jgi:hypothetical protein